MKKHLLNTILSLSLLFATGGHAEESAVTEPPTQEEAALPEEELPPPPPPREVGRAAADGVDMGKQRNLGNIAIALLAITVAVTAIILVSKNQGKHA